MRPAKPGFPIRGACVALVLLVAISGCGDRATPTGMEATAALHAVPENVQPLRTWAARGGGIAKAVAASPEGSVVLAGKFSHTEEFGRFELEASGSDMFLAKYNPFGEVTWARRADGIESFESPDDLAIDRAGNIYMVGTFGSQIQFDRHTITSHGGVDLFLAAFDSRGVTRWVRPIGGYQADEARAMAVDEAGNPVIGGQYSGLVKVGSHELPFAYSGMIAKFSAGGTVEWATSLEEHPETRVAYLTDLDVDDEGNVYVAGNFRIKAVYGESVLESVDGSTDGLVVKLDPQGRALWGISVGGRHSDHAQCVFVDDHGNVVVAGEFAGTARFGGEVLTARGVEDVFVMQLDEHGEILWARQAGSPGENVFPGGITIDQSGTVILGGQFAGAIDFGGASLVSNGRADLFVARYDPGGSLIRVDHAGNTGIELLLGLSADERGGVFIAGQFGGTVAFGPHVLQSPGHDGYVARLGPAGFAAPGAGSDPRPGELPANPQPQVLEHGGVDHQ